MSSYPAFTSLARGPRERVRSPVCVNLGKIFVVIPCPNGIRP